MSWRTWSPKSRYRGIRENPRRLVQAYVQKVDPLGRPIGGAELWSEMQWGEFDFPPAITLLQVPNVGFARLPKHRRIYCLKKCYDLVSVNGDCAVYLYEELVLDGKERAGQRDGGGAGGT